MDDYTHGRLPHTPRIVKAFAHALGHLKGIYGSSTAETACFAATPGGLVLIEALGVAAAEPLICARLLHNLDHDSYEYDNIRHEYGRDVFLAAKAINSFHPLFEVPEYLHEVLKDPDAPPDVRMIYMADAIAGMHRTAHLIAHGKADPKDREMCHNAAGYRLIAEGCRGVHPALDSLLDENFAAMTTAYDRVTGRGRPASPSP